MAIIFYVKGKYMFEQYRFNRVAKEIIKTVPLVTYSDSDLAVVSLVSHKDIWMYLIAISSFCHHLGYCPKVFVINDGSLTVDDRILIAKHLLGVHFVHISSISTECDVPIGGCWERLLFITDLVKENYVIQLDSDTLTCSNLSYISLMVAENKSFSLCDMRGIQGVHSLNALESVWNRPGNYLAQASFERNIGNYPDKSGNLAYLCGNAGFQGFAKDSFNRDGVRLFSRLIFKVIGDQLYEWGSEQLATNLILANIESNKDTLPNDRYKIFEGNYLDVKIVFIHFIGRYRFKDNIYVKEVKRFISKMLKIDYLKKGTTFQQQGSRARGEGSRIMAEGARLEASGISCLEEVGRSISQLGQNLANTGDELFAEGSKLIVKGY